MKLESYILRYGTREDLLSQGYPLDIARIVGALPEQIRARIIDAVPQYQTTYFDGYFEKKIYCTIIETEKNSFVYSTSDRTLVPYYMPRYGTATFLLWQFNFYLRTGFWIEPSSLHSISVGEWHSPKERVRLVSFLMAVPVILPTVLMIDGIKSRVDYLLFKIKEMLK